MLLYLTGILAAVLTAKLLRRFLFKEDETPFVMELPPYRVPTLNATLQHMWEKCAQYLKKIGSVILFASIIIWFLGYYPRPSDTVATDTTLSADSSQAPEQHTASYLEQIGRACEPVIEPLGLNWKAGVAFISGAAAKEIIVSTLGVLYAENDNTSAEVATKRSEAATEEATEAVQESVQESADEDALLKTQLLKSGDFTMASALSFMVFALLYFPCIATLAAIASESGSWKWAAFSFVYSCTIAWLASFVVYNICMLF